MDVTDKCAKTYDFLLGQGKMYYMLESERGTETLARLLTEYIKTDGKCVELYYWIRGGSRLELKIRGEDFIERYVAIKNQVSGKV